MPVVTPVRAALALALTASTFGLGAVTSASAASVCGPAGYAAPIATTTTLSLARSAGQYGAVNVATVRVASGAGTPGGTVRVSVNGETYTGSLNSDGVAQRQLPRSLAPSHTYRVTASYAGSGNCRPSGPVSKFYTVVRAGTFVRGLQVHNIWPGVRPRATGRVDSATGVVTRGQVRVRLVNHGKVRQERIVGLRNGAFRATFGRTTARGTWTVRAKFVANRTFRGSHASATFRYGQR